MTYCAPWRIEHVGDVSHLVADDGRRFVISRISDRIANWDQYLRNPDSRSWIPVRPKTVEFTFYTTEILTPIATKPVKRSWARRMGLRKPE